MASIYDMADAWNAAGTSFTAIKMNVTDTASAADSKLLDLQVGGVSKFSVDKAGGVRFGTHAVLGTETVTGFITITDSGGVARKLAVVS